MVSWYIVGFFLVCLIVCLIVLLYLARKPGVCTEEGCCVFENCSTQESRGCGMVVGQDPVEALKEQGAGDAYMNRVKAELCGPFGKMMP